MMKRELVLGTLIVLGGLSLVVSGLQAPAGPSAAARAATKIEKVKDNLYMITGSGVADTSAFSGGNTAVLITDAGVVIVDTKLPGWGQIVLDRIKTVTNKPVTTIINTHTHSDHTGSNEFFGTTVDSIVQRTPRRTWPRWTSSRVIKPGFYPSAHTRQADGREREGSNRSVLLWPRSHERRHFRRVPGAAYDARRRHVCVKALPYIDSDNGGSVAIHPQTLAKVVATIKGCRHGHYRAHTDTDDMERTEGIRRLTQDFVTWAQNEMKAGKTVDQAVPEYKVPAKYRGYVPARTRSSVA